jgi:hypothetical protein
MSQRYRYSGLVSKLILARLAPASWVESRLVWLQTSLSLIAGSAALVEMGKGRKPNTIEWLRGLKTYHIISPVLKKMLSEGKFLFPIVDFWWLSGFKTHEDTYEHLDLVNETLAHYAGRSKRLTPLSYNTIPDLLELLGKYESVRLDSLADVTSLIDLLGRKEAFHYRVIAGIHYSKDKMN